MCSIMKEVRAEGRTEGAMEERRKVLLSFVQNGLSPEKAVASYPMDDSDREAALADLLEVLKVK